MVIAHAVAEAYGVLEDGGLSTPAVFIINNDRQIVWSEIFHNEGSGCGDNRVPSYTILANLIRYRASSSIES